MTEVWSRVYWRKMYDIHIDGTHWLQVKIRRWRGNVNEECIMIFGIAAEECITRNVSRGVDYEYARSWIADNERSILSMR